MAKVSIVIILSLSLPIVLWAEDPVHFDDAYLKDAVERALWISDPTPADMLALTELRCSDCGIRDLTGLEYATNMHTLWLVKNSISDLTPLAGLSALRVLVFQWNQISDISPLSGLTDLRELDLKTNQVSDISPLSGLSGLQTLSLHRNRVSDLSPLDALTCLQSLDLRLNPLNRDAWSIHIPQIIANNPGLQIWYDATYERHLVISSTAGGSVVSPGEGDFTYEHDVTVRVEAKADPCFVFAGWTGNCFTLENPLWFTVSRAQNDHKLRANFLSVLEVIHVDDDAPADPGPANPAVSDPQENGTREYPFDSIQEAVEVAGNGATVFVHGGTYHEKIDLLGKRITLTGFDPDDANAAAAWPVIDAGGAGPVVSITGGEGPDCRLRGLVITGGRAPLVGAIRCAASNPTIANCLIVGNRAGDLNGSTIYCVDSSASFVNCTIADNQAGSSGAALCLHNSPVTVVNSILWDNSPHEILSDGVQEPLVRCSDIAGGWPGPGNLEADPLFAAGGEWVSCNDPEKAVKPDDPDAVWIMGDYHLQSRTGRWDPTTDKWLRDTVTSPCIDAGDPATPVGQEPSPNGGIINQGAYGGTAHASKTCFPTTPQN